MKTPWYGVERGRRRQGPAAERPVTFRHVSEVPVVQWQI